MVILKKTSLLSIIFITVSFMALFVFFSFAESRGQDQADAKQIIRKMDLLMRGDSSFSVFKMTITDPNWQRTLTMKAWEKRKERKTFIRILSPPKEAGTVTLKIMFEMWNYIPRVERIMKIPPSMMMQPWMGSDFTNDDLIKASSMVNDYVHEVVEEEMMAGFNAYKVELHPKPDAPVIWGKIMIWVRKKDSLPLRQEFFSERGKLVRVLTFSDIKELGGKDIPAYWEMVPANKQGRMTSLELIDIQFDLPMDDSIFTLKNLKGGK